MYSPTKAENMRRYREREKVKETYTGISLDVPEYYDMDFKGRKPKYCPDCGSKMSYDGWGSDGNRIDEYWVCKKCDKMFKNPAEKK